MTASDLPPPPRRTANPAPARFADSVRRTTSIDVSWPDGTEGQRLMVGRARDVVTPRGGGAPRLLGESEFRLRIADDRTITAIEATPDPGAIASLEGQRGGGHLRLVLAEHMPGLIANAEPLYLVLDDISGTALVSALAHTQWNPGWEARFRKEMSEERMAQLIEQRTDVCWGLARGNSGVRPEGPPHSVADADAGELRNPADPGGWHDFFETEGPGFRRARRIDVIRDETAGVLRVDSAFQDNAKVSSGGRVAVHEYLLRATIDMETLAILALEPEARILPFSECPGAIGNVSRLVGRRIDAIRDEVLAQLRGTHGCTHLNDALRALADVPKLADALREPA